MEAQAKSQTAVPEIIYKILKINRNQFSIKAISKVDPAPPSFFTGQVFLDGLPIPHALVQFSYLDEKHAIISAPDFNYSSVQYEENTDFQSYSGEQKDLVAVLSAGKWCVLLKVETHRLFPTTLSETSYYNAQGRLMFRESGFSTLHEGPDSLVQAAVFRPDPSTRLKREYGNGIKDRADSNSVFLTQALDTLWLPVQFHNDTFRLRSPHFEMGEYSPPMLPLARLTTNQFCFTRNHPFFEEVNVFYHLTRFRHYIDSLGFTGLANYCLRVDAHGMDGVDQSAYSPSLDVLAYGVGHVDDGEDAAVIVHEYGHVLANSALPFGNAGMERKAVEEGFCDYLAGSYARQISEWQWEKLFKWDGWNEFWAGRNLLSTKHYPENIVGQIHRDGEIFSSALMNIELLLGRATTHNLLLKTLPRLVPNLTMRQCAYLFAISDSLENNGTNFGVIQAVFESKGLWQSNLIVSVPGAWPPPAHASIRQVDRNRFMLLTTNEKTPAIQVVDLKGNVVCEIPPDHIRQGCFEIDGLKAGLYVARVIWEDAVQNFRVLILPY